MCYKPVFVPACQISNSGEQIALPAMFDRAQSRRQARMETLLYQTVNVHLAYNACYCLRGLKETASGVSEPDYNYARSVTSCALRNGDQVCTPSVCAANAGLWALFTCAASEQNQRQCDLCLEMSELGHGSLHA